MRKHIRRAGFAALVTSTTFALFGCHCQTTSPHEAAAQPLSSAGPAFVRYVPERVDDIAWENDRIAFRIYGPELETAAPPFSSGIDVWCKKVRTPIINKWYGAGEHYHIDHGEGLDCYKVGPSRGCGGIAIWDNDKPYVSHDWSSFKILQSGPDRAVFRVTYAPWRVGPAPEPGKEESKARKVWQTTTITLDAGSNLNRIVTTLDSDQPGPIAVAIGLATHSDAAGQLWTDKEHARLTWWDHADRIKEDPNDNGFVGTAVVVNPGQFAGFAHTADDNFALIFATPGQPFVYYAGAGWSKGLDFKTNDDWNAYVKSFVAPGFKANAAER